MALFSISQVMLLAVHTAHSLSVTHHASCHARCMAPMDAKKAERATRSASISNYTGITTSRIHLKEVPHERWGAIRDGLGEEAEEVPHCS